MQKIQRESVAQRLSRDRNTREPRAPCQAGNSGLDRAHRQSRSPATEEQHRLLRRRRVRSKIQLECAARSGVQRHLAGFEAFAVADAHHAGTVAQGDIGHPQRRHFADAQPGLQHHLD